MSYLDTYLGQGTRLESSRKKPKGSAKNWTKRKLKNGQVRSSPVRQRRRPWRHGRLHRTEWIQSRPGYVTWETSREGPRKIYLERIPSGRVFEPDGMRVCTGRSEDCPVRDKINRKFYLNPRILSFCKHRPVGFVHRTVWRKNRTIWICPVRYDLNNPKITRIWWESCPLQEEPRPGLRRRNNILLRILSFWARFLDGFRLVCYYL